MIQVAKNLYDYRELIGTLAWRNVSVRYKQAYLGIAWAVLKPVMLMLIFTMVKSFVGIQTGEVPYPILTFAALMPWVLFQESASDGINSVVANSALIRKIYFPREVFPLTAVTTKLIEFAINCLILAALMAWYHVIPSVYILWAPIIILYTLLVSLTVSLVGAAANVYYRDVATVFPLAISLLMYASPVIYPLTLVKETLLTNQAAGVWSSTLYSLYTANPLAGIIDAFQHVVLRNQPPDLAAIAPGLVVTLLLLPVSYRIFKRAEAYFADVI